MDLTPEAIENIRRRIEVEGLPAPEALVNGDAEHLPFASDAFDLVYSFGVLHHTPDTVAALREAVRVLRPGGELRIMLYNRRSVFVINQWVKFGLLAGRPWRSLRWMLANKVESPGTRGYTRRELREVLGGLGLESVTVRTEMTSGDLLAASAFPPLNAVFRLLLRLAGNRYDWHPSEYVRRVNDPGGDFPARAWRSPTEGPRFTGNPLGFYHCISARKAS